MSKIVIELGEVAPAAVGRTAPVMHWNVQSETFSDAATAQTTTIETTADTSNSIVRVTASTNDIRVSFGSTAVAGSGAFIPSLGVREWAGVPKGTTISVINDS